MLLNKYDYTETGVAVSAPTTSTPLNVTGLKTLAVQVNITAASAPSTASAKLQKSYDGVNWFDITSPASQNVTAVAVLSFDRGDLIDLSFKWLRVSYAIASGSFTAAITYLGKAEAHS